MAGTLVPWHEGRSEWLRAKPQRDEDVGLAAKRLLPCTLRQIATMEGKAALRPRASFFVALWLCAKRKIPTCRVRTIFSAISASSARIFPFPDGKQHVNRPSPPRRSDGLDFPPDNPWKCGACPTLNRPLSPQPPGPPL